MSVVWNTVIIPVSRSIACCIGSISVVWNAVISNVACTFIHSNYIIIHINTEYVIGICSNILSSTCGTC